MRQGQQQQLHSHITDTTATVAVAGLSSPLSVRHLSDSHISLDSDLEPHSRRMHDAFFGNYCCVLSRELLLKLMAAFLLSCERGRGWSRQGRSLERGNRFAARPL